MEIFGKLVICQVDAVEVFPYDGLKKVAGMKNMDEKRGEPQQKLNQSIKYRRNPGGTNVKFYSQQN